MINECNASTIAQTHDNKEAVKSINTCFYSLTQMLAEADMTSYLHVKRWSRKMTSSINLHLKWIEEVIKSHHQFNQMSRWIGSWRSRGGMAINSIWNHTKEAVQSSSLMARNRSQPSMQNKPKKLVWSLITSSSLCTSTRQEHRKIMALFIGKGLIG